MIDNALTSDVPINSTLVGQAQGFYAGASQHETSFLMAMNFAFKIGKYNGSTITILGRNTIFSEVRKMPVVGGRGIFRLARAAIKVTPRERIVAREKSPLQEEVGITEVEVSEQQTDDILLIDVDNHQYEDLFDDMTDEEGEEEFDASDDDHCTDIDENSNDSE
uniref:Dirigent protein n=1 Tax=Brassica oleracea var. oleracea TaxID=109376 RepID=A0A0D3ADX0_BRAOL